jgi:hypothetical protein
MYTYVYINNKKDKRYAKSSYSVKGEVNIQRELMVRTYVRLLLCIYMYMC